MAKINRLRVGFIGYFYESKPAGLPCRAIAHNGNILYGYALLVKKSMHVLFSSGVWEISYKKLFH
jgi:hypothetical protein